MLVDMHDSFLSNQEIVVLNTFQCLHGFLNIQKNYQWSMKLVKIVAHSQQEEG